MAQKGKVVARLAAVAMAMGEAAMAWEVAAAVNMAAVAEGVVVMGVTMVAVRVVEGTAAAWEVAMAVAVMVAARVAVVREEAATAKAAGGREEVWVGAALAEPGARVGAVMAEVVVGGWVAVTETVESAGKGA